MFSYKANAICMAGMTMPARAGVAASHYRNRVRRPGQFINYARFWPHRWTFAKNRTAHAQTHYWKSTQWQWDSFVSGMHVVFCKIDHCIHIHWCIVMGLGYNDPWVESHMWPQQTWGQRSSRGQWPLVQVFGKNGQCIHILWCIFKSNITMIAKVCDRERRRDTWFREPPCFVSIYWFVSQNR